MPEPVGEYNLKPNIALTAEFLSAFFPDLNEDIHLRAFAPRGSPNAEQQFLPKKWRTCREVW